MRRAGHAASANNPWRRESHRHVRAVLYRSEHQEQPPAEVLAALLAQGQDLGSISSFHRIPRAGAVHGERRLQRRVSEGRRVERCEPPRLGGELPGVQGGQGLEAVAAGRRSCGALHGGTADAPPGATRGPRAELGW